MLFEGLERIRLKLDAACDIEIRSSRSPVSDDKYSLAPLGPRNSG
jgi:hypothetical protein